MSAVLDLFAGPGGWDIALAELGQDALGVELEPNACATRGAAGLRTLHADVGELDPRAVLREHFATATLDGLIASPPCQAFSMAGKGAGRRAIDAYLDAIHRWSSFQSFSRADLDDQCDDPRAHLVLEPLRWATALRPTWVALEQVPPVLPIWQATARALQTLGYHVWTGVLSAERYGVPQTRERAILLAHCDRPVGQPPATHQSYIAPRRRDEATDSLFDAPDPQRIVRPEEGHLQPWVSMAEALGWATDVAAMLKTGQMSRIGGGRVIEYERGTDRPAPTVLGTARCGWRWNPADLVGFPRRNDRPDDDAEYRERDLRAASEPAFALTEKTRSWIRFRSDARPNATVRNVDEPAPTIKGGHTVAERAWVTHLNPRQSPARSRAIEEPAPTMLAAGLAHGVPVWDRGEKGLRDTTSQDERAIRVSLQEAAILQSFPPDYPWQGSKSRQFEQVGNAFPPLMALRVLETVVDAEEARAA